MTNQDSLLVYNIQKFSVHDGPGIRMTVFLKGCPLQCLWCHNPESQIYTKSISINQSKCINCNLCVKNCPSPSNCILCGKCIDVCPSNARVWIGEEYSIRDLIEIINKDKIFYEESNGGVTFSGGEPLIQAKILSKLLKEIKLDNLHVAIDTSGYCSKDKIDMVMDYTDLWLYDLKHMNSIIHNELTGVGNEKILENLIYLDNYNANIWIRFPFIPGFNSDEANLREMGEFVRELKTNKLFILPYHNLAEDKHNRFEFEYKLKGLAEPTIDQLENAREILIQYGLKVQVGG
ncbi:MAG: glycyl-radical enzyme activating protein [Clostridia bacterium]